ncbi:unnamed protein product [Haemonchus placei]|uniref:Histidine phosphatase family protein n=1 Tax=Haemonchus placei TaxID=6290 RepID=A0A0N4WLW6_HAEPC|nr:unnamed protein product [Haemonchus placei]
MIGMTKDCQLFRHGARAPHSEVTDAKFKSKFANGLGELTTDGIEGNKKLGKYLEKRYVESKFLRVPLLPQEWPMFEGFVFECLGLHKNTTLFKDAKEFSKMEALYIEKLLLRIQVFAFNVGAGDVTTLQLKQGKLLHTILETFKEKKEEHEKKGKVEKKKLIMYSTQDWILQALLNGIGAAKEAIGEGIPNFNSMIIFEMRTSNKTYTMQVFYKDGEANSEKEITQAVRGCSKTPCPYEEFLSCCNDYKTTDPNTVCHLP